jgi:YD repeat-containing protein
MRWTRVAFRERWFTLALISLMVLSMAGKTPASAANGSVVYTYDALGRVTSASYDTGIIVLYAYDANGNRTQQVINVNTGTGVWDSSNWDQTLWGS